jgi:hypothetical protein
LNEDAQKLRDNAALLDELSNKLEQKAQYFRGLADNASMKAYMGSGFTPLVFAFLHLGHLNRIVLAWLVFLQYQNKGLYFFGRQEV